MASIVTSQNFAGKTGNVVPADLDDFAGDIIGRLDQGIDNSNVSEDAGISWTKLAQPYHAYKDTKILLPDGTTPATWVSAPGVFTLDGDPRLVEKQRILLADGQLLWLCRVEVWIGIRTAVGGSVPRVTMYKNGTIIGGATFDLTNDDVAFPDEPYFLGAALTPFSPGLLPFTDGDILEYRLGRSSAAGSPTARNIKVTEWWKTSPIG